jgi:hypothetical protein
LIDNLIGKCQKRFRYHLINATTFSTKGAIQFSPGQRPGSVMIDIENNLKTPTVFRNEFPARCPWAKLVRPFGAFFSRGSRKVTSAARRWKSATQNIRLLRTHLNARARQRISRYGQAHHSNFSRAKNDDGNPDTRTDS